MIAAKTRVQRNILNTEFALRQRNQWWCQRRCDRGQNTDPQNTDRVGPAVTHIGRQILNRAEDFNCVPMQQPASLRQPHRTYRTVQQLCLEKSLQRGDLL